MTFADMILIGVAVFAVLGAVGAFTIAFRRAEGADPTAGVSAETRRADRSMEGVAVAPIAAPEAEAAPEVPAAEAEAPVPVGAPTAARVEEVSPEESGVSRRQFFNRAMNASFFSFLGILGINSLAFFWPKLSGGFGTDVDAGAVTDVSGAVFAPDGSIVPLFVPEGRAYVVPAPSALSEQFAGKGVEAAGLMAVFQRCVHLGCRVPWCAPSQGFECPCHGSKYDAIGEYFAGPAPRNLDVFAVEVKGGRFLIKTGTIVETPRAPTLSVNYPQGPSCIGAAGADEA